VTQAERTARLVRRVGGGGVAGEGANGEVEQAHTHQDGGCNSWVHGWASTLLSVAAGLLDATFTADLAAFGAQSPILASRYRD
jgi:hypothetical protein